MAGSRAFQASTPAMTTAGPAQQDKKPVIPPGVSLIAGAAAGALEAAVTVGHLDTESRTLEERIIDLSHAVVPHGLCQNTSTITQEHPSESCDFEQPVYCHRPSGSTRRCASFIHRMLDLDHGQCCLDQNFYLGLYLTVSTGLCIQGRSPVPVV